MSEILKKQLANVKIGNLKRVHQKNHTYPLEKKVEVVSQYLVLGNMKLVSAMTGVDYGLIRQWKIQPWWLELEKEIRATQNIAVDNKLSQIIERSMEATLDRIENGEIRVDRKTNATFREPVVATVAARVANDFLQRQSVLRKTEEATETVSTTSVVDQLKALAIEFAKWSSKQNQISQIVDVEVTEVEDAIPKDRNSLQEMSDTGETFSTEISQNK